MNLPETLGHERRKGVPQHFVRLVTKQSPRRRICVPNRALIVDRKDAFRRRFCQNLEAAFILRHSLFLAVTLFSNGPSPTENTGQQPHGLPYLALCASGTVARLRQF